MIRQISWLAVVPQLLAIAICVGVGIFILGNQGLPLGALVYLVYSIGSRRIIPRDHRQGIRLVRQGRYADAIPCFERSLAFFNRHPWIDRYRSVVLMSPSAISYREMALANIGFSYAQIGDGNQAQLSYEKCLEQFPDSMIAQNGLQMILSGRNAQVAENAGG